MGNDRDFAAPDMEVVAGDEALVTTGRVCLSLQGRPSRSFFPSAGSSTFPFRDGVSVCLNHIARNRTADLRSSYLS